MNVLPVNFHTLRILGLWYEEPRRRWPLKLFHQCLVGFVIAHFTAFQLVTLVLMRNAGIEVVTGCLFLSLTYVASSCKILHFVSDRPNLEDLLDKLRLEVCQPRDPAESAIARRHRDLILRLFVVRMITTLSSGFAFLSQSFVTGDERQLPFNAYEMFNITSDLGFGLAYTVQFFTTVLGIGIDVSLDATACAFIVLISAQLELLSHRIASTGGRVSKEYVVHHNLIFAITRKVRGSFISIVLPVFMCGLFSLCSSVFQLAQTSNTLADYVGFFFYIEFLLIQLYYYCWCGNELELKSEYVTDAVFRSDWTTMTPLERRNYWFIMFMGQKKLMISYHGQCSLNLNTYIWMLKSAYGAYNLLQRVSTES